MAPRGLAAESALSDRLTKCNLARQPQACRRLQIHICMASAGPNEPDTRPTVTPLNSLATQTDHADHSPQLGKGSLNNQINR